jgi:hypothetical protein
MPLTQQLPWLPACLPLLASAAALATATATLLSATLD